MPVAYRANASWIFSPSAFSSLAGLIDTAGGLVLPSLHAAEPTLFGQPVYVSPDFPAAAANARSATFGDWSLAYTVRRVRGLGVQRRSGAEAISGGAPNLGRPSGTLCASLVSAAWKVAPVSPVRLAASGLRKAAADHVADRDDCNV